VWHGTAWCTEQANGMFSKQRNRRFIRRGPSSVAVPGRKLLNTRSGDRLAALQSFQRKSSPRAFDLEHYSEADLMGSNPNYNDLSPIRPNPFHTIAESVPLLSPKKQPSHSVLLNELEEEDEPVVLLGDSPPLNERDPPTLPSSQLETVHVVGVRVDTHHTPHSCGFKLGGARRQ